MKELTEPVRSHAFSQQQETVTSSLNLRFEPTLNLDYISYLEREELELDEIISLIFLLYEDSGCALQELQNKLQDDSATVLLNWASNEENAGNFWQMKVIEALCVIKNYQILKKLGYSKQQMILRYSPQKANQATYINKLKKALYITCENLNREKTEMLLRHVSCFFLENNKEFTHYNRKYLELYLLSWEKDGFISKADVTDFRQVFKLINEDDIYDMLNVELFEYQQIANDSPTLSCPKYYIDPNNPGVLLIINQENFHTDVREERKHLLPSDLSRKLGDRVGSQKDVCSLSDLFATRFGFKVIVAKNLFHNSTLKKIKDVISSIKNESSLFVCILSHGNEGVVYGANSCRIRIGKIQSLMCKTNKAHLSGKPKVLILQACQGVKSQKVNGAGQYASSTDSEDDDDKSEIMNVRGCVQLPRTIDLLTLWSTVPGYSTVRETETGSWFIQTLCKQLEENGNTEHFLEIGTRVTNEMANKTWVAKEGVNVVVSLMTTTLRYRLYLPALKVS